ncbi:phosphoribosyltransferase [Nocardia bovistercoris]|uniref:Phosphoribosyltransferase n=1 Tax=Nocardia bovistercoris TaxID=2785916 RepID=A0A931I9J8_9NOCA|nr:phosphoribosyltransferase family protein [Nocardia bovistercoris]MBH0775833.1 phosphoribosyltransferase [Nocardia bovistercoris]
MGYPDRIAAGRVLGARLEHLREPPPLVLGLPRGGVPVAAAVREVIGGDLDILLVRKLGVPWQPELAMGAIGERGARVLNPDVVSHCEISAERLAEIEADERVELERRRVLWRGASAPVPLEGRVVVLVDDGMATGATVAVACRVARLGGPARIVVAVPVSSAEAVRRVAGAAEEVVCPWVPETLGGVGAAYGDFHQLEDEEVTALLR